MWAVDPSDDDPDERAEPSGARTERLKERVYCWCTVSHPAPPGMRERLWFVGRMQVLTVCRQPARQREAPGLRRIGALLE